MRRFTGFIQLRCRYDGETPWFWSRGREHGLWWVTIHAGWLHFEVIGPFRWKGVAV